MTTIRELNLLSEKNRNIFEKKKEIRFGFKGEICIGTNLLLFIAAILVRI